VANPSSRQLAEDSTTSITLTGSDPEGASLTYSVVTSPQFGTLTGTPPNLTYQPNPNYTGTDSFTFKVNDGAKDSTAASVSLTVIAVNDPPTLDTPANLVLNESPGPQTVALSGITSGASNEPDRLTVTATSSNPSLIPNPTVAYTSPGTTGQLTFTPVTYGYGTAVITVTANDNQSANSTVSRSFTVNVLPVNQAPTLNPIANLSLNENAGLQTVQLSGIGSGAYNEADLLTLDVVSSNPALVPNPSVNYAKARPAAASALHQQPASPARPRSPSR